MSAHYPAMPDGRTDLDRERGTLPPVALTRDNLTIDDVVLSSMWIEAEGIHIEAGDRNSVNRVTVTFLVGEIDVSDEVLGDVAVNSIRTLANHACVFTGCDCKADPVEVSR